MKGLLFHQQFEIRVEVEGEEFHQGDTVTCKLSIKNRGDQAAEFGLPLLALARGDLRKVKKKDVNAFETIEAMDAESIAELSPGEQTELSTSFALDVNCLVTDKSNALCILYGVKNGELKQAHLALNVLPHADIEGILGVFETSYQFVVKSAKTKSGRVSAKLTPPDGRRFRSVEELELNFHFKEEVLELKYVFKTKQLEAGPTTLEVQKKKQTFSQQLTRPDYMAAGGYIDSVLLEPKLEEILSEVGSKFF